MALGEKLAKKTQALEASKTEAAQKTQEEELAPIRAKIQELESQMHQLRLVKGSLELKSGGNSGEKTGKGMREYSTETAGQVKKESGRLDTSIEQNKEALRLEGIENRDQLAENPEYAAEEEVVSYKESLYQNKRLKVYDSRLQKKLQTLGINIDAENFSYDSALKAIEAKLQPLEQELIQEKLKTPEGKEEAIDMIAKKFENLSPPRVSSGGSNFGGSPIIRIKNNNNREYADFKDTDELHNNREKRQTVESMNFLPGSIKKYKTAYGEDITKEAIRRMYKSQMDKTFRGVEAGSRAHLYANILGVIEESMAKQERQMEIQEKLIMAREAFQKKEAELLEEMKKNGIEKYYNHSIGKTISQKTEAIESNRKKAIEFMTELTKLESELPKEPLVLDGYHIRTVSVQEHPDQIDEDITRESQRLEDLKTKISQHKDNKPKLFGKDKWEEELSDLKQKEEELRVKIRKMDNEGRADFRKKNYFNFPNVRDSRYFVEELLKDQKNVRGNPSEIFNNLRTKLREIMDKKMPEAVMKLYGEYQELEKQLKQIQ